MSKYKNGLHKDLSAILSGVPIPEPNRDGSRWLFGSKPSAGRQKAKLIKPPTRETFGSDAAAERRSAHHKIGHISRPQQAAETGKPQSPQTVTEPRAENPEQAEMMTKPTQSAEPAPVQQPQKPVDIIPTEKLPQPVGINKPVPESSLPEWARPKPIPDKGSKAESFKKSFKKIWR